jgi:hypothetical protein
VDHQYVVDERLAESLFHDGGHRVLGYRLQPFSFWHKLQLERWNSRVLLGGATLWDVWLAAKVCCTQYPNRPALKTRYSSWWHLFWWVRFGRYSLQKELQKFAEYLREYNAPPKTWEGIGSTYRKLGDAYRRLLPFLQGEEQQQIRGKIKECETFSGERQLDRDLDDAMEQIALLCRHGHPPSLAWNMPVGELVWLNVAMAKVEGAKVNLWTPLDDQRMEHVIKHRKEKIANMALEIARDEDKGHAEALAHAEARYWEATLDRLVTQGAR